MRLTCLSCTTAYVISADRLQPAGRTVKCARCGALWQVDPAACDSPAQAETPASLQTASDAPVVQTSGTDAGADPPDIDDLPSHRGGEISTPADAAAAPVHAQSPPLPPRSQPPPSATARPLRGRSPPGFWARPGLSGRFMGPALLALGLGATGAAIVYRTPLVSLFPDLASLYRTVGLDVNRRGLAFRDLAVSREFERGAAVLVVEADVVNLSEIPRAVPALRFGLRAGGRREIFAWVADPKLAALEPGGSARVRSRIPVLPEGAAEIELRFAAQIDAESAGTQRR